MPFLEEFHTTETQRKRNGNANLRFFIFFYKVQERTKTRLKFALENERYTVLCEPIPQAHNRGKRCKFSPDEHRDTSRHSLPPQYNNNAKGTGATTQREPAPLQHLATMNKTKAQLEQATISAATIPAARYLYTHEGVQFAKIGNLCAITSTDEAADLFAAMLMASALKGECNDINSHRTAGNVVYIDTANTPESTRETIARVNELCGWSAKHVHPNFAALNLSDRETADERRAFVTAALECLEPVAVFINDPVNLCDNLNDIDEGDRNTRTLYDLADEKQCAVFYVIHTPKAQTCYNYCEKLPRVFKQIICDRFNVTHDANSDNYEARNHAHGTQSIYFAKELVTLDNGLQLYVPVPPAPYDEGDEA